MNAPAVEGATAYAVARGTNSNTPQKLVARILLSNVYCLESLSYRVSYNRELCVPCLQLQKFILQPLFA